MHAARQEASTAAASAVATCSVTHVSNVMQEFCTKPAAGKPEICTKLYVTEAKPEKQTW
jgi:hypothetical protein